MKIAKTLALHTLLISLTLGIEALEQEPAQKKWIVLADPSR